MAVLAPSGALVLQSGVQNAISEFLKAGFSVDVYAVRNKFYEFPDLTGANVFFMPLKMYSSREPRLWVTFLFSIWLTWKMRESYAAVFAGGVRALLAASLMSLIRPQRIINLQLELYVGPKADFGLARVFKYWERKAIQKSWISIIHDENRAQMLSEDASIKRAKIEIVPNSPIGPGRIHTSRMLHDIFQLSSETRILLAPGTIGPQFQSEEIVVAAQHLSDRWHCVVHSSQRRDKNEPYIEQLVSRNVDQRVSLSLTPIPYKQLDDLIGSAQIGLALYGEVGGDNTTQVGLASGKLCHFLKLGVPIIVSDYPVLRNFVTKFGVGVVLSDINDLPKAVAEIEGDYAGYRNRSLAAFDSELAFEQHFSNVIARIDQLVMN